MRYFAALLFLLSYSAFAQGTAFAQTPANAQVVSGCGTPNGTYVIGQNQPATQDTTGLLCTKSSGGGGGGAVTIADGADVTQGAIADAAAAAGGTGTVSAKLRETTSLLNSILSAVQASINYASSTTGSVSTTATIVATPGAKSTTICNTTASGGATIWLEPHGDTAVIGQGFPASSGNGCVIFGTALVNAITAVSSTGTATYTVTLGN